jgi:hypothetical protein
MAAPEQQISSKPQIRTDALMGARGFVDSALAVLPFPPRLADSYSPPPNANQIDRLRAPPLSTNSI